MECIRMYVLDRCPHCIQLSDEGAELSAFRPVFNIYYVKIDKRQYL